MVRPIGYNESTLVHIHSKCGCSCGVAQRCYDYQQQDHLNWSTCRLQGRTAGEQNVDCRAEGSDFDCSGRGVCECGKCVCEQSKLGAVYGKHCELDDFSCPYEKGLLCAGNGKEKIIEMFVFFLYISFCSTVCLIMSSLYVHVLHCVSFPSRQRCMCVRPVRV